MTIETVEPITKTRGILYDWFSKVVLLEPNQENFAPFVNEDVLAELKELLQSKEYGETLIQSMMRWKVDPAYQEELIIEFNDLFKVPGGKYLFPYESCYREKNIDDSIGQVYGCSTVEVKHIYKSLNINMNEKEIPDHLGLELLLMGNLCLLEYLYLENHNEELANKYHEWQKGFLYDHLLHWGFEILRKMNTISQTDFYQSISLFMIDFIREEQKMI